MASECFVEIWRFLEGVPLRPGVLFTGVTGTFGADRFLAQGGCSGYFQNERQNHAALDFDVGVQADCF